MSDNHPTPVQVLRPDGSVNPDAPFAEELGHLGTAEHHTMYNDLVTARAFDNQATALQRQGELALWAPCLGQEAAQVGSARALTRPDWVFPSYREHAVLLARGIDPAQILPLFRGASHGGWNVHQYQTHLYSLVVGAQTLLGVGFAQGLALDATAEEAEPGAVLVYLGDGATAQGDFNEALVFAGATGAPVVFFIQNNGWAISTPTATQSRVPLVQRGSGFGIPGVRVDGNDVLACRAVTTQALRWARDGQGPQLIEAVTYRMGAHTTADDPSRYRSTGEEQAWAALDPIERYRSYLLRHEMADQDFLDQADAAGQAMASRTRQACQTITPPGFDQLMRQTYATPHGLVDLELAERQAGQRVASSAQAAAQLQAVMA